MIHRKDDNQLQIIQWLRDNIPGLSMKSLTQVDGFVDLALGWMGINHLWEFKTPKTKKTREGKLTKEQQLFIAKWSGDIKVIRTLEDALDALGIK